MLLLFPLLLPLLTTAQAISFLYPGPGGADSVYVNDPNFKYGSSIEIQWTSTSQEISLVLNQQTQNAAFEYIFQNSNNYTSYPWVVSTTKDLTVSRIFFFQIFLTGVTSPAATSHYFNITGDAKSVASSSSSSSSPPASSSAASSSASGGSSFTGSSTQTTNLSAATTSPASNATGAAASVTSGAPASTSTSAASNSSSSGLSTGAKIGLGVGIPFGVIGLGLLGYVVFLLRKRNNNENSNGNKMETMHGYHQPQDQYNHHQHEMYKYDHLQPPQRIEMPANTNTLRAELPGMVYGR